MVGYTKLYWCRGPPSPQNMEPFESLQICFSLSRWEHSTYYCYGRYWGFDTRAGVHRHWLSHPYSCGPQDSGQNHQCHRRAHWRERTHWWRHVSVVGRTQVCCSVNCLGDKLMKLKCRLLVEKFCWWRVAFSLFLCVCSHIDNVWVRVVIISLVGF